MTLTAQVSGTISPNEGLIHIAHVDPTMMLHALQNHDFSVMDHNSNYRKVKGFLPSHKPLAEHKAELLLYVTDRMSAIVAEMDQLASLLETQIPEEF